jgi:HEAT repeat protein
MALLSKIALAFDFSRCVEGESGAVYGLLSQLVSKNPDTHTEIIAVLEGSQEPDLWRHLLEALALHTWHGNPIPVAEAIGQDPTRLEFSIRRLFCSMAETPAQRAKIGILKESIDHNNPFIRYHAALLLGRRGDEGVLSHLVDMLNSGDEVWAISAANVLGEMAYRQAADALVDAMSSGVPGLYRAAEQALEEMGALALPALMRALRHSDNYFRFRATCTISRIGGRQAIPALLEALEDVDIGVRWLAGEALACQEDEVLEPLLQNLVHKPIDASLREGTLHVLARFQRRALRAVAPVVEALKSVDYAIFAPMAAYKVLQKLHKIKLSK